MRNSPEVPKVKMGDLFLVGGVFKALLNMANCSQHYRIEISAGSLRIRESTHNPPIPRRRERFNSLINSLQKEGIFTSEDGSEIAEVDGKKATLVFKTISNIKKERLFEFLGIKIVNRPKNVNRPVWIVIPDEIKARWDRFSKDLQDHIVTCCTPFAEKGIATLIETRLITNSLRSPISFDVPKIPVRLPNPDLEIGASNEVYDLLEILNIKQRNPKNPELRLDPMNRRPFDLTEVIPAKEAYDRIQQIGIPKIEK